MARKIKHVITHADGTETVSRRSKLAKAIVVFTVTEASRERDVANAQAELDNWLAETVDGKGSWTREEIDNATARKREKIRKRRETPVGTQEVFSWHSRAELARKNAQKWASHIPHPMTVVLLDEDGCATLKDSR